ncbi:MAG: dihydrofolate reductase [Prevotella sp.]|nr:dihydrofolate reductase [Prevotella sp.]
MSKESFNYSDEKFADIQLLRYRLNGFDELSLQQKTYVYYLSKATLAGRDITTDQWCRYNLRIRKTLEAVWEGYKGDRSGAEFQSLKTYLYRVWFSNGIHHHYGCVKFTPGFTPEFLQHALADVPSGQLPLRKGESVDDLCRSLFPVIFDSSVLPKRVDKADGIDVVQASACNYYEGVTQAEVEDYYRQKAAEHPEWGEHQPSYGLNSRLVKHNDRLEEQVYKADGIYGPCIRQILYWLGKAAEVAENKEQQKVIALLMDYYRTGDLRLFDDYSIEWLRQQEGDVDFINGFIEVYGDPLGLKGSWEGLVEYRDREATQRTRTVSSNAQWFEDHSPVDARFRKPKVVGVSASVICAAMLGGDEYPASAIGINLPNADWIRAEHGSKSVTIGNLTEAYNKAAEGNGFYEEFVPDDEMRKLIHQYGSLCDDLHTDLHECLGHGSGQLLPGVSPDALGKYADTIEEARADLYGLYFIADPKLMELGLMPNGEAWKAQYYTYMLNGLMTQLARIEPGHQIEEAHMRNRALIAHWVLSRAGGSVQLLTSNNTTRLVIKDYSQLRHLFALLLAEIQRIKSTGDFKAARQMVEDYGVKVDARLHSEVRRRYAALHIAPYKGFINPWMRPVTDANGHITDIQLDFTETFEHQMMRYSRDYGFLRPWEQ